MTQDSKLIINVRLKNIKSEELKNVVSSLVLDEQFDFEKAYIAGYEENGVTLTEETMAEFDENTRTVRHSCKNISISHLYQRGRRNF